MNKIISYVLITFFSIVILIIGSIYTNDLTIERQINEMRIKIEMINKLNFFIGNDEKKSSKETMKYMENRIKWSNEDIQELEKNKILFFTSLFK